MSNMLKCPNPSCPYVFDPSQVPVGVVLSCPRCAMQFTLGPPQPATTAATTAPTAPATGTATTTTSAGQPAAPATQSQPQPEDEFEEVGRTADEERDPHDRLPTRGTNKLQVYILAGVACVCMALTGLAGVFWFIMKDRGDRVSNDSVQKLGDDNIGFDRLPEGWVQDDEIKVKVGSPAAISFRRESPEAHAVLGINRFGNNDHKKGKLPKPSEMKEDLNRPFGKLFVREKDNDTLTPEPPIASNWLGETIATDFGLKFRAQSQDGLIWAGEAYVVSHKGIAYYWWSWCLESDFDGMKKEFADFRGRFKTLELRKEWQAIGGNVADFKGDKIPYTISDTDEVWKELSDKQFAPQKLADPDLDKRLEISRKPRHDRKALPIFAELNVYVLDIGGDPLDTARRYVEEKERARRNDGGGTYKVTYEELKDEEQGDPVPQASHESTPAVRLKSIVENSKDSSRLLVVSGLKVDDKIIVVECWCEWTNRRVFESRFVQIAKSLR